MDDLGLSPWLVSAAAQMGLRTPTPIQAACIGPTLSGRDVLATWKLLISLVFLPSLWLFYTFASGELLRRLDGDGHRADARRERRGAFDLELLLECLAHGGRQMEPGSERSVGV